MKEQREMKMKCPKIHGNTGKNNPMYGKKHSPETIMKMKLIKQEENNPFWKGDNVGYRALHAWINRHKQKPEDKICEFCNQVKKLDTACVTGIYNRDLINWKYLCKSCHKKLDFKNNRSRDKLGRFLTSKCRHKWIGYVIRYCEHCKLLKDFVDGFPNG